MIRAALLALLAAGPHLTPQPIPLDVMRSPNRHHHWHHARNDSGGCFDDAGEECEEL